MTSQAIATTTANGTAVDAENQEFLSITDYKPSEHNNNDNTLASKMGINIMNNNNINKASSSNSIMSAHPSIAEAANSLNIMHAHPRAAFFTVCFKALAVFLYIFGTWMSSNFVLVFVFVIIAIAADFWTVKNVTGRMLVGLRWWNEVKDDGSSEWKFESKNEAATAAAASGAVGVAHNPVNHKDSRLFWSTLYLAPAVWFLLLVSAVVKFNIKWLPLTLVGIVLNGAQLWGYWKCQRDAKRKLTSFISQGVTSFGVGLVNNSVQQQK